MNSWIKILTERARELEESLETFPPYNQISDQNISVKKRMMERNLELANNLIKVLSKYARIK